GADRTRTAKTAPQLLRSLLSTNVCFGHRAGTQGGIASAEGHSSEHVGPAPRAPVADTRDYWYSITDTYKHARKEKEQREAQKENTSVTSGLLEMSQRVAASGLS